MEPYIKILVAALITINLKIDNVNSAICTTPGFTISNDSNWCFGYSDQPESWPQKSVTCRGYGATLVTIEDTAKQTTLDNYLSSVSGLSSGTLIWIGLTNALNDSQWNWYQKGRVSTSDINWDTSYPSTSSLYNCGFFEYGVSGLRNQNCLQGYRAVCQKKSTGY